MDKAKKVKQPVMQQAPMLRYRIVETDSGPLISESRTSVFDVMEAQAAGDSVDQIAMTFNLSPLQVQTALAYIVQHRAALEPQLAEALRLRGEREHYYRAIQAEIKQKITQLPMTPQRVAFYALREQNHRAAGVEVDAVHSQ